MDKLLNPFDFDHHVDVNNLILAPIENQFVLDEARFLEDIEEIPLFLRDVPPLKAYDLVSMLGVLAGH